MKLKVYKIFEKYSGVGDPITYANENGVIEIANMVNTNNLHRCWIQTLEEAIGVLNSEGYIVEEQTDVIWSDNAIVFEQGV